MKRAELIDRLLELADYVEPREWDLACNVAFLCELEDDKD